MKKYKIKYKQNSKIKSIIVNLDESNIKTLPKDIIEIKEVKFELKLSSKINQKQLTLLFYELSLMLTSNIAFSDAIDILIKNKKDEKIKEFLELLKYFFTSKKDVKDVFDKFGLDNLVISFLELIQKTGNINLNIKLLYELLIERENIKKDFFKAISYPLILLGSFFISLISIFYFVIPKFKVLLESHKNLGFATKSLFWVQNIFENYLIFIILGLIFFFFTFLYYYRTNQRFIYFIHKFLVKDFFIFKEIYLCLEFYKIFLIIDNMLKLNYEFYKALNNSKVLLENRYLLAKISNIENLLYNGEKIDIAFSKSDLFDDIVLNLLNTAAVSNSLSEVVGEIKKIYKNRFDEKTKKLINLIQPIFLVLIMSMILWIVLAIFVPIWDMGNMIKV